MRQADALPIPPDAVDCAINRVRFLTAGRPARDRVRPAILASWERSREHGIAADRVRVPYLSDPQIDTPLTRSADPVLDRLAERMTGNPVSIILTDPQGVVLSRRTPDPGFEQQLDHVLLAPGFTYAEKFAGTNGIGTALETGRATQVLGHEHYAENLERLACAAVPVRHPVSGRLAGILDLTCWRRDTDSLLLTLAESTVEHIQHALSADTCAGELAVLAAFRATCQRVGGIVFALAADAVLLNDEARRELGRADQAALLARAREVTAPLRPDQRRTIDESLSDGRAVRLRCRAVAAGARSAGVVVTARIARKSALSAPGTPARAPLDLVGTSLLWRQACTRARGVLVSRGRVALRGEPGTGKLALAQALARETGARAVVLDARQPDSWTTPSTVLEQFGTDGESGADGQLVVTHADELGPGQARLLAGLLDLLGTGGTRPRVVVTLGEETLPPPLQHHLPDILDVPPLRSRADDIPDLARHFLGSAALSPEALRMLVHADWPGNIAQLQSAMRHARQRQRGGPIGRDELPADLHRTTRHVLTPLESIERDAIVAALDAAGGDKAEAAKALGISRATVYRRVNDYGIRS